MSIKKLSIFVVIVSLALALPLAIPSLAEVVRAYSGFPTFSIVSVDPDHSVTITTSNLPSNDTFVVTMGQFGTKGIGGIEVARTDSGSGGVKTFTYNIPDALKGQALIAIRMQSPTSGYFAYNWFANRSSITATAGPTSTPGATPIPVTGYTGFPTFSIISVEKDKSVTIQTSNLHPNDTFTVTMGKFGTKGIGGVVVANTASGTGGTQTFTYNIPDSLKGQALIAIRMQSPTSGYFAYNWFVNSTGAGATPVSTATPGATPIPATGGYSGFPTFSIVSVDADTSVTIKASNLPPNDTFTVTMGAFGTKGIGGVVVATTDSGSGGAQTFTYNIPSSLKGASRIAIRMQSSASGYFAYNWFWNQ